MYEFDILFTHDELAITYLTIGEKVFGRRSGFYGNQFDHEKMVEAIGRIADDIRRNYGEILAGDVDTWRSLREAVDRPENEPHLP